MKQQNITTYLPSSMQEEEECFVYVGLQFEIIIVTRNYYFKNIFEFFACISVLQQN